MTGRMVGVVRGVLLVLAGAALPACGGSGSGGSPAAAPFAPNFPAADVRLEASAPGAVDDVTPKVCARGSNIYVVWVEQQVLPTQNWIRFNRSADGGATWLAAPLILNPNTPNNFQAVSPQIACDGSSLYVSWEDNRNGVSDVFFNRSFDGGITWLATERRIDHDGPGNATSWRSQLRCSGLNVYVSWLDRRNGGVDDVYFNRSTDGGDTWLASDTKINASTGGGVNTELALDAAGALVCVLWLDYRNGSGAADVYFDRSTDGGAAWLPADVRVDHAAAAVDAVRLALACSSSAIVAAWEDKRGGALSHVYENRSLDGGVTWRATDTRLDPTFAVNSFSGSAAVVGMEAWYSWLADGRIWVVRSSDGGETWGAETRVDREPGSAKGAQYPLLLASDGEVFVVWGDLRSGAGDIYFTYSLDGGATWPSTDLRLDTDLPAGGFNSYGPAAWAGGHRFCCVWMDYRSGKPDIRFAGAGP